MKILRTLKWGGISLAVLLGALLLGRNLLIKQGAKAAVKAAVGLDMDIADLDVGLFASRVRIEGLTVHNPEGFGEAPLAKVPVIYVDYEAGSLLGDKPRFTEIEVNVAEVSVVKNSVGELNLNRIRAIASQGPKPSEKPKETDKKIEMQIDRLTVTVGRVRYLELDASGNIRKELDYSIGVDHEVFEDLRSPEEIVRLVVLRAMGAAGLKGLGLSIESLASAGLDHVKGKGMKALESIGEGLKSGAGKAGDAAKGLFERVKEKLGD